MTELAINILRVLLCCCCGFFFGYGVAAFRRDHRSGDDRGVDD